MFGASASLHREKWEDEEIAMTMYHLSAKANEGLGSAHPTRSQIWPVALARLEGQGKFVASKSHKGDVRKAGLIPNHQGEHCGGWGASGGVWI